MNYYNENDPKCCAWLAELIAAGLIPAGEIDNRSICDVQTDELREFNQCHFFAGIGGWAYALRLAGWPEDKRVWTGSCPCQPFSILGKGMGESDERHLWPYFRNLVGKCKPATVFGEQVASPDGRKWLNGVSTNLEAMGYRFAAADLCAAGVGAPHRRQRLFWVADTEHGNGGGHQSREQAKDGWAGLAGSGGMVHASEPGLEGHTGNGNAGHKPGWLGAQSHRSIAETGRVGAWSRYDVLQFRDGKARRVESGTFPMADGVPGRVGILRGYGNAIVPQAAGLFIKAYEQSQKITLDNI